MRIISLVSLPLLVLLAACAPAPTPIASLQTVTLATPTPNFIPSTPTPSPEMNLILSPTPEIIQSADLGAFATAWSSHDDSEIRQFYAADARYFTENEIRLLTQGQPVDVLVSGDSFEAQLEKLAGYSMRILGTPMMIFDKLVAFAYRWENGIDGYNGMSLLRYENGKILLHVDLISSQPSKNQDHPLVQGSMAELAPLMRAWNEADLPLAQELYTEDAQLVSDEDLLQVTWRDFPNPPGLETLLLQFAGWKPEALGDPLQVEDMQILAWHWYDRPYPVGYGLRLLRYENARIVTDVRFVVRPWETEGNTFLTP